MAIKWECVFAALSLAVVCGQSSPVRVQAVNQTQDSLLVSWLPVRDVNLHVISYNVKARPIEWHSTSHVAMEMDLTLSNATLQAHLVNLQPGTRYNVTVEAMTPNGLTDPATTVLWTLIGLPESPSPVEIISRNGSTMKVKLQPGKSENGPVTGIQVVVLQKTTIVSFNEEQLFNSSVAEENGMPFYITALLKPEESAKEFVVGDGRSYGGYFNAPLGEDARYEVLQGTVSSLNGVTKTAYSSFVADPILLPGSGYDTDQLPAENGGLTTVLAIAVGVFGFLLVMSVLLYFLLRRHYGKRRPSDELVLNDHITEGEENGCVPGMLQLGAEANLGDFWDLLKERYPAIPRSSLEIADVVLGCGQFGEVRAGKVYRRGTATPVLVQFVQNHASSAEKERRALYSEMDAQLRLGSHESVTEFVGLCEEGGVTVISRYGTFQFNSLTTSLFLADILHLVGEHYDTTLRGMLLRSRQTHNGMICSLSPNFLFNCALKVAEGMKYLTDHGIPHRHLSTRSVAMVDGYQPKITNFGLFFYNPLGKRLDFTRWQAPEVLKSRFYTPKADIWSFGALLWEICTLGGTPFADIPTREIYPRVVRGLRLQRIHGASDELYQLMLQCWELDSDERPTFLELCTILKNMSGNAKDNLRLEHEPGFQFHKFLPSADEL